MEKKNTLRIISRCYSSIEKAWNSICNQEDFEKACSSIYPNEIPPEIVSTLSNLDRIARGAAWNAFCKACGMYHAWHDINGNGDYEIDNAFNDVRHMWMNIQRHFSPWLDVDFDEQYTNAWRRMFL